MYTHSHVDRSQFPQSHTLIFHIPMSPHCQPHVSNGPCSHTHVHAPTCTSLSKSCTICMFALRRYSLMFPCMLMVIIRHHYLVTRRPSLPHSLRNLSLLPPDQLQLLPRPVLLPHHPLLVVSRPATQVQNHTRMVQVMLVVFNLFPTT